MSEPRFELKIGTPVIASDGAYGHVHAFMIHAPERRVLALVVVSESPLAEPRLIPRTAITDVTDAAVRLWLSRSQIAALPPFDPERSDRADEKGLLFEGEERVYCLDGYGGQTVGLLLDERGDIRHLILRRGHVLGPEVIVPVDWVGQVGPFGLHLTVARETLSALPEYVPDGKIASGVERTLAGDDVLRTTDYHEIAVAVRDGIVTLSGYTSTLVSKARAEEIARHVPGVLGVENHLVADSDLVDSVAQALAQDARMSGQPLYVRAHHGVITLTGQVNSADVRMAAEQCAARVPRVRAVVNLVQAPGVTTSAEAQRVLEPVIGQDVWAADMRLGQVERVILSPLNRRVTALVVHGEFPDPAQADAEPSDMAQVKRDVVIPAADVCHVTDGGVLLSVSGREAAGRRDFNPADFMLVDANWQPPYPYRPADVLLEREAEDSVSPGRDRQSGAALPEVPALRLTPQS